MTKQRLIGQIIKDIVDQQEVSVDDIAKKLGRTKRTVWRLFHADDVSMKEMKILSKMLNHNFFSEYLNIGKKVIPYEEYVELKKSHGKEIQEKEKRIKELEDLIEHYKLLALKKK
jgi:predicted transcriptional regulator